MPNENEHPRYTDPDHPYSGSGLRYQNNYNRNEYHAGDGPFQFPWWAIVIGFVVWWPLGFIFIGLNAAMKNGKLGSFEQKARTRTQSYRSGPSVQEGQFRPIYAQQDQESAGKTAAAPRDAEKKRKGMALANGLTVAGVLLLLTALAALPGGTYWLPDALTGDLRVHPLVLGGYDACVCLGHGGRGLPVRRAPHPHRPPLAQKDRQYCR